MSASSAEVSNATLARSTLRSESGSRGGDLRLSPSLPCVCERRSHRYSAGASFFRENWLGMGTAVGECVAARSVSADVSGHSAKRLKASEKRQDDAAEELPVCDEEGELIPCCPVEAAAHACPLFVMTPLSVTSFSRPASTLCNSSGLLHKLEELKYSPPPGMRRVPFIETLAVVAEAPAEGPEAPLDVSDDLKREAALCVCLTKLSTEGSAS